MSKCLHIRKALLWIFGNGRHYHVLNINWDRWDLHAQARWRDIYMLTCYFRKRSLEGTRSAQPLVHDNSQRILIASQAWHTPQLFGSHVSHRTSYLLRIVGVRLGDQGNAKIGKQSFIVCSQQEILWLDVAMDQLFIMRILQTGGELFDVVYNGREW